MRKDSRRTRRLASYAAAVQNEIAIEHRFLGLAGVKPGALGHIPRVPHWVDSGRKHAKIMRLVSWLARHIWVTGGAALFFSWQFFSAWRVAGKTPRVDGRALDRGGVLAFSIRVGDVVDPKRFAGLPGFWLTMPWAPLRVIPAGVTHASVFEVISRRDVWQAFLDALASVWLLRKRRRTREWILQTYTAFRWFAVRLAVDRIQGPLVMAEHFDRWSVLADSAMQARCNIESADSVAFTLIQHGSIEHVNWDGGSPESALHLSHRLRRVTHLHAYNQAQEKEFKRWVFTDACVRRGVAVSYFKPGIVLDHRDVRPGTKILFVGHPLCEPLHIAVLTHLREQLDFIAYYKPHPLAPMTSRVVGQQWQLIDEPDHFPAVDMLISYPSTLAVEYETVGVRSLLHPLDFPVDKARVLATALCHRLAGEERSGDQIPFQS